MDKEKNTVTRHYYTRDTGGLYTEYEPSTGNNYKFLKVEECQDEACSAVTPIPRDKVRAKCAEMDNRVRHMSQVQEASIGVGLTDEGDNRLSYRKETAIDKDKLDKDGMGGRNKKGELVGWSWAGEVDMFSKEFGMDSLLPPPVYGQTIRCEPPKDRGYTEQQKKEWCENPANVEPEAANAIVGTFDRPN